MRRGGKVAIGVAAALATAGLVAAYPTLVPASESGTSVTGYTVTGYYTPASGIPVSNHTIAAGIYRVGYSMEVYFAPVEAGTTLTCLLVDTSGRIEFFRGGPQQIPAGEWTKVGYDATFDLPDLTLGIRCKPSADGGLSATFRSVNLYAYPRAG
ncbi:MAG: hypothetical protein ABJB03_07905 [Rhodoglobus sp.]